MKSNELLVMDIVEAIRRITAYGNGVGRERFLADIMIQDAVIRNLEIIGEATKKSARSIGKSTPIFRSWRRRWPRCWNRTKAKAYPTARALCWPWPLAFAHQDNPSLRTRSSQDFASLYRIGLFCGV